MACHRVRRGICTREEVDAREKNWVQKEMDGNRRKKWMQ
jgi:hypothetical protein